MNDKIKKYIIPNLPYAFIGVLIGNLGEAYRLAAGHRAKADGPHADHQPGL